MKRGDIESSTESERGGLYSKAARGRSEEIMWDVQTDVNYKCGIKAPAKSNTRRKVRVKEKLVDRNQRDQKWTDGGEKASRRGTACHARSRRVKRRLKMRRSGGNLKWKGTPLTAETKTE